MKALVFGSLTASMAMTAVWRGGHEQAEPRPMRSPTEASSMIRDQAEPARLVTVRLVDDRGQLGAPLEVPAIVKSDAHWRLELSPERHRVLRERVRESAGAGLDDLPETNEPGIFACAACGLPLFANEHRIQTEQPWPMFARSIATENVCLAPDTSYGMPRVAVECRRCRSHLGHVVESDAEAPAKSFSINSAALTFHRSNARLSEVRIVFGAGCFWGVEAAFAAIPGVLATRAGYAGGIVADPTYEQVCAKGTAHAEVVEVKYAPNQCSLDRLLQTFWGLHDPALERNGGQLTGQYRSAIFFTTPAQERTVREGVARFVRERGLQKPIVTQIDLAPPFFPAEDYHQKYHARSGARGCRLP